jgi:hypothetical protein
METKLFEVRDKMTFIPVICIKLEPGNPADQYLLGMAGYGLRTDEQSEYILYGKLQGGQMSSSPMDHNNVEVRTNRVAHSHIIGHWEELNSGDVIDVEFIVGETGIAKTSQRLQKSDGI